MRPDEPALQLVRSGVVQTSLGQSELRPRVFPPSLLAQVLLVPQRPSIARRARSRLSSASTRRSRCCRCSQSAPPTDRPTRTRTNNTSAAPAGFRRHHRQARSSGPTRRARIGSPLQEPPQVLGQRRRVGVPPRRILVQALQADRLQVARHFRVQSRGRHRLVVRSPAAPSPSAVSPRNGGLSGEHLVEQGAERVDVRGRPDRSRLPDHLLGGHVARSPDPSRRSGSGPALRRSAAPARNRRPWACRRR